MSPTLCKTRSYFLEWLSCGTLLVSGFLVNASDFSQGVTHGNEGIE